MAVMLPVECKGCGAKFRVPEEKASQRLPCIKCKALCDVPDDENDVAAADVQLDVVEEAKPAPVLKLGCDCGAQVKYREEQRGKKLRCPKCKAVLDVPIGGVAAQADAQAPPDEEGAPAEEWRAPANPLDHPTPWDWIPLVAASIFFILEAFMAGPFIPFALASRVPVSAGFVGSEWAFPTLAILHGVMAIVSIAFLLRVEAARVFILMASSISLLVSIAAYFVLGGTTMQIIGALVSGATIACFVGSGAVRYVGGLGISVKLSRIVTAIVVVVGLILCGIGYSASSGVLAQMGRYDEAAAVIEKARRAVGSAEDDKQKKAAAQEAIRAADAGEREADQLRGLMGDRATYVLILSADMLRLDSHGLQPFGAAALKSLAARCKQHVDEARKLPPDGDRRRAVELDRLAGQVLDAVTAVEPPK